MLVYGRNVALEVLKKPKNVQKVLLQDGFDDKKILALLEKSKIPVFIKPKKEIDHLAEGVHQGIILYVRDYQYYPLADIVNEDASFLVILDHLEDPHNFGAIIRTCEAAGVDGIIIPKDRQVQVNATVMKTSVGTLDTMKVSRVANLSSTIDYLKKNDFWVVGTALEDSVDYRSIDYSGKIALVIGNEGNGLREETAVCADCRIRIPMEEKAESLNAAVAAAILMFEAGRQRRN